MPSPSRPIYQLCHVHTCLRLRLRQCSEFFVSGKLANFDFAQIRHGKPRQYRITSRNLCRFEYKYLKKPQNTRKRVRYPYFTLTDATPAAVNLSQNHSEEGSCLYKDVRYTMHQRTKAGPDANPSKSCRTQKTGYRLCKCNSEYVVPIQTIHSKHPSLMEFGIAHSTRQIAAWAI